MWHRKDGNTLDRVRNRKRIKKRQHINSFPCMESPCARKDSKREYLDNSLYLQKIYELYVDIPEKEGCTKPASESTYRSVFNFEFNLSFLRRMKDRCDICAGHENLLTDTDMAKYRDDLKLKDESRNYEARVKDNVKKDPYMSAAVFDLQEVLQCPTSGESSLSYKQKLIVYYLTVYNYRNGQGHCNVWSEVDAMRGSNEIATCGF